MVSFLRTPTAAFALPAALAVAAAAASTSATPRSQHLCVPFSLPYSPTWRKSTSSVAVRISRPSRLLSAVRMDSSVAVADVVTTKQAGVQKDAALPDIMTEFMVDMKCDGCVKAVKNKLSELDGIKRVDADLENQVVKILGNLPVKTMAEALEQTGRKARLIGQGNPDDFLVSAAVAEFKGPEIFGVVRFGQVNMELARIEANFSGLSPGKHGWSINEFGDLTKGPASTGKVFNPVNKAISEEALGNLGTLEVQENGEAQFSGYKETLRVIDLIGRSVVVYGTEDKSDSGMAAAVIARSAGVGENYKKLCTCDGVTIWESS